MKKIKKVLQICPADEFARFVDARLELVYIECWALVEYESGNTAVVGMYMHPKSSHLQFMAESGRFHLGDREEIFS